MHALNTQGLPDDSDMIEEVRFMRIWIVHLCMQQTFKNNFISSSVLTSTVPGHLFLVTQACFIHLTKKIFLRQQMQ